MPHSLGRFFSMQFLLDTACELQGLPTSGQVKKKTQFDLFETKNRSCNDTKRIHIGDVDLVSASDPRTIVKLPERIVSPVFLVESIGVFSNVVVTASRCPMFNDI